MDVNKAEWVKTVEASNGQTVLFYLENSEDHEECDMIHCYSRFDGFDIDMKLDGIPKAEAQQAFDAIGVNAADVLIASAAQLTGEPE